MLPFLTFGSGSRSRRPLRAKSDLQKIMLPWRTIDPWRWKKRGRFCPCGRVQGLRSANAMRPKKGAPPPPSGSEGEHFGYSTKSYRHYHLQLRGFDRKTKSETITTKSVTFCHFLNEKCRISAQIPHFSARFVRVNRRFGPKSSSEQGECHEV